MKSKNLLVNITHSPLGSPAGLMEISMVLALASAPESHKLRIVFSGDGVYFALKDFSPKGWEKILKSLRVLEVEMHVEEESLKKRGLSINDIKENFTVRTEQELASFPSWADHALAF
ncbi:MAG: DsrE family protein [Chloroflexi bacterium]|nr:DsrE family protein [Chloroflexota bacterium]